MITKTETIDRIEILMHRSPPAFNVFYTVTLDDPDDDQLPIRSQRQELIEQEKDVIAENGGVDRVVTDITGQPQVIQGLAAMLWAE